ncbi:MAG: transketolase family protein [Spirochaetaceae bacterium]|jgi:transketolase|nr:transketolase family protein [Spirochaetaceae bacterium]
MEKIEKIEKMSLRKAYGEALRDLGKENEHVVALEADLGKSTMSALFKEAYPERYFEMGIAEQNMASAAAGMALAGKIPFYSTFAVFAAGRAYDQIRCSIAIPKANVKICGSSCGLSDFGDGKTHQSVEDGNIIGAIPNMTVLHPVDAVETRKMMKAIAVYQGPVYIRINRNDLPVYTAEAGDYTIGAVYPVRSGTDAVIFATGALVWQSVEAAGALAAEGISVQVVNVSTLKPLIKAEVLKHAAGKRAVLVAEEAVSRGGLGHCIAALLFGEIHVPFGRIAIQDEFGTSAHSYEELLDRYGLSSAHIYRGMKKLLCP